MAYKAPIVISAGYPAPNQIRPFTDANHSLGFARTGALFAKARSGQNKRGQNENI
jgi:hypothetical protein